MKWEFIVDSREKDKVKNRTFRKFPESKAEALYAGDFAARKNRKFLVGVERKTLIDFVGSTQTKRIFKQVEKLHKTYPIVIIILEGRMPSLYAQFEKINTSRAQKGMFPLTLNESAFWGTLSSIVVRDNFQIFWSDNLGETIYMAHSICQKIVEGKYRVPRRWKPKGNNTPQDLLELIPGVTNKLANQLIKRYGSIYEICLQTQKELCSNEGVGPSLAKRLRNFLCGHGNAI